MYSAIAIDDLRCVCYGKSCANESGVNPCAKATRKQFGHTSDVDRPTAFIESSLLRSTQNILRTRVSLCFAVLHVRRPPPASHLYRPRSSFYHHGALCTQNSRSQCDQERTGVIRPLKVHISSGSGRLVDGRGQVESARTRKTHQQIIDSFCSYSTRIIVSNIVQLSRA
jgi:hypothetical protein